MNFEMEAITRARSTAFLKTLIRFERSALHQNGVIVLPVLFSSAFFIYLRLCSRTPLVVLREFISKAMPQ